MKAVYRIAILIFSVALLAASGAQAQRVVKGTVYRNGEPAAGINVEVHRGGSMMTSFDGKYELEAHEKSKWIKFTYVNDTKRLDIRDKEGDVFDFAMEGELPGEGGGEEEVAEGDVILKSADDLIKEQDRDFMNSLSLYREHYKQEDYESALEHWKVLYNKYPKSTLNLYIHGSRMYRHFIEEAENEEEKEKHINNLMKLYDQRIKYFGEEGYVLGRKASRWLKYKLDGSGNTEEEELQEIMKKGYDWLSKSVEIQGVEETELPVLVLLMQTTRSLFKLRDVSQETVVKNYETCNSILDAMEEKSDDEEEILQNINEVRNYIEDIFGTSGAADCDALVGIFAPQFEENKDDEEFIKSMLRRLGNADCEETALFSEATERLYDLDPSAEAAFNMARRYVKRDDIERAKDYYKQAMDQETDEERLSKYYYEYAVFVFAKEDALREARDFARKALAINPDYCEANSLIGDIYVAASRSFGEDDFDKATVFWLAVDYFERARSNPDCAVDASKKASDYRRYFPDKEEAFFRSLQEGETYKVGGWINESTKVRF